MNRRRLMQWMGGMASGALLPQTRAWALGHANSERAIDRGPFQPNWDSLKQYTTPDWFRDAKFGIWAHWSAQCVPEQGDWYARQMYRQGQPQYDYHVAHYGHPSKVGFMQIDHLWKAEAWDPEELMRLYVRAGAKYFVSLATTTITSTASIRRTSPGTRCASGRRKTLLAHGPRWRASMGSGSGSVATPLMHGAGFRRRMAMMRKDLWLASAMTPTPCVRETGWASGGRGSTRRNCIREEIW